MSAQEYAQGGYVGGGEPVYIRRHPDDCLIAKRGDTFTCIRAEHKHGEKR